MPDTSAILRLLHAVRRRTRGNRSLQALVDGAAQVLGLFLALTLWNAVMPEAWGLGWPLYVGAGLGVLGWQLMRLGVGDSLADTAQRADGLADLHDELTSAYWFARREERHEEPAGSGDWVDLHLARATDTARGLRAERLVPWRRPRGLALPALLAVGLVALLLLPVPRVFDDIAERIGELALGAGEDLSDEPLAALEELGDRTPDPDARPEDEEDLLMPMGEQAESSGEDALPEEEGTLEEMEEPEGEMAEGDEPGAEGEQGEQTEGQQQEAQSPEDAAGEQEGEASPDPSAGQDDGDGESSEEEGPMLPGGEEVFLQEGGEDVEQQQLAEEEMGHATREGGGEEELELGELTTLEVQLERELLGVPEEEADPESEDKEELITRAERSFLEYEQISTPDEFAVQQQLQSESIPWRYRQLVLNYFKTLRERDNMQQEQE